MAKELYWRISEQHYDYTKSITCKMSYGFYFEPKEEKIKNQDGFVIRKYFKKKEDARKYMLNLEPPDTA